MNIAALLDKTIEIKFDYHGESQVWEVRENSLTPKLAKIFQNLEADPEAIPEGLAAVIVDWNMNYNGGEFSPSRENLARLPFDYLEKGIEALNGIWTGKPATPAKSPNGSRRTAK